MHEPAETRQRRSGPKRKRLRPTPIGYHRTGESYRRQGGPCAEGRFQAPPEAPAHPSAGSADLAERSPENSALSCSGPEPTPTQIAPRGRACGEEGGERVIDGV